MRLRRIGLVVQGLFYIVSGANHFWHPGPYLSLMPDHYSHPAALIALSGGAEVLGGVGLLLPATRRVSALSLALMLLVFLDVHLFMLRHPDRFPGVPVWALWSRLPLQAALVAWALLYAQKPTPTASVLTPSLPAKHV